MVKIIVYSPKGGDGKSTLVPALADVLPNACVVDMDPQKTLTNAGKLMGRHIPVDPNEAEGEFVIYDTPPYRDITLRGILAEGDIILLPMLVGYSNLMALNNTMAELKHLGAVDKAVVVFNKVRKPHTKTYRAVKALVAKNYPNIRVATTELSLLRGFSDVLISPVAGQARGEIEALLEELLKTSFKQRK